LFTVFAGGAIVAIAVILKSPLEDSRIARYSLQLLQAGRRVVGSLERRRVLQKELIVQA